jgi:WD40 repeat protein
LYRDLTPEGQEAARQMFLRLVTLGEGVEDTRRRALRSELLAIANGVGAFHEMPLQIAENTDLLDEIIDTYAAYRLLTLDNDVATRTPTVELAHEAILREWERLRNWLNDSRADIKMQRQLSAMADEWRANKEDTSYLARGSRLEQFEQWTKETNLALTPHERTFLNTSIAERERQNVAEQERQAREARLERRSRNFLRGLVAVLLSATLGAFGLTGIAVNQSNAAQIERDNAQRERDLSQSLALASAAQLALNQHNPDQAVALAVAANRIDNPPAFAQSTLYNIAYAAPTTRRLLRGHTTDATSAVFSPDEKRAVSSSGFGTAAGEIIVWDLEDGREIQRFGKRSVIRIALSPDGRYIAAAYFDREDFNRGDSNKAIAEYGDCAFLALWDVETGKEIRCFKGHSKWVWGITFSADGKFLFSASDDSTLIQWDTATGQIVRQFKGHQYTAIHLALSPDEHTLLSGSCATMDSNQHCVQGEMILWDIATGAIVRRYGQEGGELKSWVPLVVFSPDGKTAVSVSETGQSRPSDEALLWDVASGKVVRRFEELPSAPFDAAFSPDGRLLALAFGDGELILYDVATGKRTMQLYGHTRAVNSVAFSADGRRLLTASNDDTVRLWNLDNAAQTRYRYLYALSPDGRSALSGDGNDLVLWNTQTGEEIRRFQGHHDLVTAGAFSPDGRYVLSGSADKSLILWELATGKVIHTLTGHAGRISPIVVSPDGHQALSTGDGDPNAILWDLETGQEIHRFAETTDVPFIGGFSPDEHAVLVGYMDGALIMYDVATSKEIRRFQHNDFVSDAVFSPDGKYILSGSGDSLVHLWDVQTGQEVRRFTGHASMINQVVFSPNGRLALSGSKDNSVILWDVATGAALRRWESQNPFDLAFSPDGQSVFISAFGDNTTQRWQLSLDLNDLLAWTRTNRYIPELTCDQRALYRLEPLCDGDGATPPSTG